MNGRKLVKRFLSLLLALTMVLTLAPVSAEAEGNSDTPSLDYRIVHLDCGRKYFSVDNIKSIIDTSSEAGFNYLELAVGNDGLRFLLDDMSLTVGEAAYESAAVTGAVQAANKEYYDAGEKNELTQAEMDEIIAYANEKGMGVIPLLNTPGHMNAIVSAMETLGINGSFNGSANTVDVTNSDAVAFTKALLQKYVTYFAGKGCTLFNFGADEYANDIYSTGGMGFAQLVNAGQYDEFVAYINDLAAMIKGAGMTPMAFNDGIYYNQITSNAVDTDIMVTYWSSGWSGYNVASASFLAEQGFKMINTHGDYYWVLGKENAQCSAEKAAGFDATAFMGSSTISNPAGAMFCIWCDVPGADTADSVVANTKDTIIAFGGALTGTGSGGDEGDTDTPVTVTDSATGISITANGLTGVSASKTETDVTVEGAKELVAYEIVPTTDAGNYTGSATVSIPVSETWTNVRGGVLASDSGEEVTGIEGTLSDGNFTFEVPHFSTVIVYDFEESNHEGKTVTVSAGGTYTDTISGVNYAGTYETDNNLITVTVTGTDGTPAGVYYEEADVNCNDLINSDDSNWRETGFYCQIDGNFYSLYAKRASDGFMFWYTYTYTWGYSTTGSSSDVTPIGDEQEEEDTSATPAIDVYTQSNVEAVPASTTITFTADWNAAGQTAHVTIGNIDYTINVPEEDLSRVEPQMIEYWITNGRVTADGANSLEVAASEAYGEDGRLISELVPDSGLHDGNPMVYWKTRRLPYNDRQTGDSGVDKTTVSTGTDITYIRYWNGEWQYSADGSKWISVRSGDQLVAYYLQQTDVTDEINTQVVDYGSVREDWSGLDYLGSNYVLLDYSVKYESGEEVPSSFPTDKSIGYHCVGDNDRAIEYRTLGMIRAEETADYEVYLITLTPTSDSEGTRLRGTTASGNTSYMYEGTEVVAWAATQEDLDASGLDTWRSISGKFEYSIGGEPIVPGLEIYRQHGMKVTYYVRAKVTEDSLSVHYVDQAASNEFYNYNIAVAEGTLFDENIRLNETNWKGNLDNGSVTNINNRTQTVSADLSTLPQISQAYAGREYTCVQVVRSEDGKDVYLYYDFTDTYPVVYDYGLPITVTADDLNMTNVTDINVENGNRLISGTADADGTSVTYTPTTMSPETDQIQLTVTYNDGNTSTTYLNMIPATSVYYEDDCGLITYSDNWGMTGTSANVSQAYNTTPYGYDAAYAGNTTYSNDSAHEVSVNQGSASETATFTFTGTGFDLYSKTGPADGLMKIQVSNGSEIVKTISTQNTGKVDLYHIPIVNIRDLEYGTYTVTVTAYAAYQNDTYPALSRGGNHVIDGVQIYNPLTAEGTQYLTDHEANAVRLEVRDAIISAQDYDVTQSGDGVLYLNAEGDGSVTDYTIVGPNNEVYFDSSSTMIGFILETSAEVDTLQIGAKSADGSSVTLSARVNGETTTADIDTNTTMNYVLTTGTATINDNGKYQYTVYISKSAGDGILSITDVKATFNTVATAEFKYNDTVASIPDLTAPVETDAAITENGVSIATNRVRYGRNMTMEVVATGELKEGQAFAVYAGNRTYTVDGSNLNKLTVSSEPVANADGTYTYTLQLKPYTYSLLLRQTTFTVTLSDNDGAGTSGSASAVVHLI